MRYICVTCLKYVKLKAVRAMRRCYQRQQITECQCNTCFARWGEPKE